MVTAFLIVFGFIVAVVAAYFSNKKFGRFLDFHKTGKKIGKAFLTFAMLNVVFLPTWIFFLLRSITNPEGFWQNLAITGLGLFFLGAWQLVMIVGAFIIAIFASDY